MDKRLFLLIVVLLSVVACTPQASPEMLASTYVAATSDFTTAVAVAASTGVAATFAAMPTNTSTSTSTATPRPSATPTQTETSTPVPTETTAPTMTVEPTIAETPLPTETATPDAATVKVNQLYARLADLKYYSEQLYSGLGGTGSGYRSCSRELSDSIIVNLENVLNLPVFDDNMLSRRAIGARINYDTARGVLLESSDIAAFYDHCVSWVEAGKPEDFGEPSGNQLTAISEAQQAKILAELGINN